ncbi:MAG TPA: hypothetical protein VI215_11320 [Bacteroidota bacterium]|jgi:hypothetical protein
MTSRLILVLASVSLIFGLWNCEDLPPTGTPGGKPTASTAHLTGFVHDVSTNSVLANASVSLTVAGVTNSVTTGTDGVFRFEIDLAANEVADAILNVHKNGYINRSLEFGVAKDTTIDVGLTVDLSTSATIVGVVRDSVTLYPLRNTNILVALPGVTDAATTPIDGSFQIYADLVDRDSLPVTITAFHDGYKTKQIRVVLHKGRTTNLGGVLMSVDVASTVAQVLGRVLDSQSNLPLNNAKVTIVTNLVVDSVLTSVAGEFSFTIDLQGLSSISGLLKLDKPGYSSQAFNFSVPAGQALSQTFTMDRDTTTGVRDSSATGSAHSIAFIGMSSNQISVYGVGGTEATILTWEVRDSLGFPIDFDHRDTVQFSITGAPVGGGAYVSPATAQTNASGRVSTTVNSGTVSGVIQFSATLRRNSDGAIISSTPVIITVNAGLPDQAHFTIGFDQFNFPGWDWVNHTDGVLVQVGDKYSNPVKVGTAVYFSTTGGLIDASGFTDVTSHARVLVYSGNPRPVDPFAGIGFGRITATTIGENAATVSSSGLILFSGISQISNVNPLSFAVARGGASVPITFTVSDENGNPLSATTHITVTLQYTPPPNSQINLVANGDVDVTLGDVQARGVGSTQFSFRVVDQTIGGVPSQVPVTVVIKVTSPNGNPADVQLSGTIG